MRRLSTKQVPTRRRRKRTKLGLSRTVLAGYGVAMAILTVVAIIGGGPAEKRQDSAEAPGEGEKPVKLATKTADMTGPVAMKPPAPQRPEAAVPVADVPPDTAANPSAAANADGNTAEDAAENAAGATTTTTTATSAEGADEGLSKPASPAASEPLEPLSPHAGYAEFLAKLRKEAETKGIPAAVFNKAFAGMAPDFEVLAFTTRQPEHNRAPWDYVGSLVSDKRVAEGRQMLSEHADALARIEQAYGVDKHLVVALWGIETSYGAGQGGRNILRSLGTLAFADARRADFWKDQLLAALRIVADGDIEAANMGGSWAGAMGHTQFMPTTFRSHAVDFDGDGRRDIWNSIPDALASAANYIKASKWQNDQPWGFEVILPSDFDYAHATPGNRKPIEDWLALGVSAPNSREIPAKGGAFELLLPAGARGPAFLVGQNFKAILKYNNSSLYALSAGLLAERLRGNEGIGASWPTDLRTLTRSERKALQKLLVDRGLDTGGIDGILGAKSRAAIRSYQAAMDLPADGFPTSDLLEHIRLDAKARQEAVAARAAAREPAPSPVSTQPPMTLPTTPTPMIPVESATVSKAPVSTPPAQAAAVEPTAVQPPAIAPTPIESAPTDPAAVPADAATSAEASASTPAPVAQGAPPANTDAPPLASDDALPVTADAAPQPAAAPPALLQQVKDVPMAPANRATTAKDTSVSGAASDDPSINDPSINNPSINAPPIDDAPVNRTSIKNTSIKSTSIKETGRREPPSE